MIVNIGDVEIEVLDTFHTVGDFVEWAIRTLHLFGEKSDYTVMHVHTNHGVRLTKTYRTDWAWEKHQSLRLMRSDGLYFDFVFTYPCTCACAVM